MKSELTDSLLSILLNVSASISATVICLILPVSLIFLESLIVSVTIIPSIVELLILISLA